MGHFLSPWLIQEFQTVFQSNSESFCLLRAELVLLVLLAPLLLLASRGPRYTIRSWNIQHYWEKLLTGNQAWRTLLLIRDAITQGVCFLFKKIISLQLQNSINLKIKKMLVAVCKAAYVEKVLCSENPEEKLSMRLQWWNHSAVLFKALLIYV